MLPIITHQKQCLELGLLLVILPLLDVCDVLMRLVSQSGLNRLIHAVSPMRN